MSALSLHAKQCVCREWVIPPRETWEEEEEGLPPQTSTCRASRGRCHSTFMLSCDWCSALTSSMSFNCAELLVVSRETEILPIKSIRRITWIKLTCPEGINVAAARALGHMGHYSEPRVENCWLLDLKSVQEVKVSLKNRLQLKAEAAGCVWGQRCGTEKWNILTDKHMMLTNDYMS